MTILVLNLGCDRSAARTPSANKEPRYGLRYTSPAWASPSRDTMHARWGHFIMFNLTRWQRFTTAVVCWYVCPLYRSIVDFLPLCVHLLVPISSCYQCSQGSLLKTSYRIFYIATKYIYIKSTTVYVPSLELGLSPPPLSIASVQLPPRAIGGRAHSPAGEGLGKSQFRRLKKKLSTMPTLCILPSVGYGI